MEDLRLTRAPVVETGMLIRRPVEVVFEAFVDPAVTTRFWFTRGSGRLEEGRQARWDWEMYGISVPVDVKAVEPGRRILIEWPGSAGPATVEWSFKPLGGSTFVVITSRGFGGDGDAMAKEALDSMQGFSLLLAGAKAFLEHGIELRLVADHSPEGL
jgi:uncharacterized protein YndB with AHSA1/START domain